MSLDSTAVHRNLPVAASSSGDTAIEAHRKAPTLMAAEEAGANGEVQVWAPDSRLVRRLARGATAALGFYVVGSAVPILLLRLLFDGRLPYSLFLPCFLIYLFPWMCACFYGCFNLGSVSAARKKRYITTDNAGIGITTARGSQYFKWEEIVVAYRGPGFIRLYTPDGRRVSANLFGYPELERRKLVKLISSRAGLEPYRALPARAGKRRSLSAYYLRPGYRLNPIHGGLILPPGEPSRPELPSA